MVTPLPEPPGLVIDPATVTQWCVSYDGAGAGDVDAIDCIDAIELALRAVGPVQSTVTKAEFTFDQCSVGGRCLPPTPDLAHVVLTSRSVGSVVVHVARTPEGLVAFPPQPGPDPQPALPFAPPPVDRPALPGAPPAVRDRAPYPFCGRVDIHAESDSAHQCFIRAVTAGSPAELIEDGFSVEGDPITILYRFNGGGAVVRWFDSTHDRYSNDGWSVRTCAMYRHADPNAFNCD